MAKVYILIGNVIYIMAFLFSIIRFALVPNLDEVSKFKKLERVLFVMAVFIFYCSQLIIYPVAWSFGIVLE